VYLPDKFRQHALVTDELFSATLDKAFEHKLFWQKMPNNKTQKTNNNQIQNINDQKLSAYPVRDHQEQAIYPVRGNL